MGKSGAQPTGAVLNQVNSPERYKSTSTLNVPAFSRHFTRHVASPEDLQGGGDRRKNTKGIRKEGKRCGREHDPVGDRVWSSTGFFLHVPVVQRPDSIVCSWQGGETGGILTRSS